MAETESYIINESTVEAAVNRGNVYTPVDRNDNGYKGWMRDIRRGVSAIFEIDKKIREAIIEDLLIEYEHGTIDDNARYAMIDYYILQVRMKKTPIDEVPDIVMPDIITCVNKIPGDALPENGNVNEAIVNKIDSYFESLIDKSKSGRNSNRYRTPHNLAKKLMSEK